jgi:hypothetical protein
MTPHASCLARLVVFAAAFFLLLRPSVRADDWKFDVVVLKSGVRDDARVLKGLFKDYKEGAKEIEIRVVHREDGEPTRLEPSTYFYERSQIESIEPLAAEERTLLERRLKQLDPREVAGRLRAVKPEAITIDFGKNGKKAGFRHADEGKHFTLEANVSDDLFRRSAVALADLFNAYAHVLPPPETTAKPKPVAILLAGTQADYRAILAGRGLNIFNPAFYDPANNTIVCGTDLVRLGEQLERARKENKKVSDDLTKREEELKKLYPKEKVPAAVLRPIKEGRAQLAEAEAANTKLFTEATGQLFGRLRHESFHAYVANFVFVGDRAEMPRWLNEGLAQLFETALFEADEVRLGRPDPERLKRAQAALAAGELVPLKDLLRSGPKQFLVVHASEKETSDRYYLTSWALALYLADAHKILGSKQLDAYCAATHARDDPLETFAVLVGIKRDKLGEFEEKFHRYLRDLQPKRSSRPK